MAYAPAQPRIAVLIPAHNAELVIGKALASLAANVEPHDIVIVDDGSRKPLRDCLIPPANATILQLDTNVGVTRAANHGLRYILERGYDYVVRLDADDTAAPDRLKRQITFMSQHPDVALSGGCGRVVSEKGETLFYLNHPTDHDTIVKKLFYNSCFLQPTFMMRVSALRAFGLYNEDYPNAEDYELVRRIAQHAKLANLPDYLIDYTVSSGGLSVAKRRQQLRMRLRAQWQYRDFGNIHFYAGVLKTLILWVIPMNFIAALKRMLPAYKKA